jgi:NTP pyrophosphatase (non-canonical NTP hydrolase)
VADRPLELLKAGSLRHLQIVLYLFKSNKERLMLNIHTDQVLTEVGSERERQDRKWGPQNHGFAVWLMILAEEFGEVAKEANEFHFAKATDVQQERGANDREELVQVAAVAVAMIESYDRNEGSR